MHSFALLKRIVFPTFLALIAMIGLMTGPAPGQAQAAQKAPTTSQPINPVFDQASQQFGVPVSILKDLCYMEGRLSNHGGSPSRDDGYGCMHLVKNKHGDTLDSAAKDLNVSPDQLKADIATNIRGGAAVLRDYALQISGNNTLPTSLADWYGVIAAYSNASTQSVAHMYADGVYKLLKSGFSATTENGETVAITGQQVTPNIATAAKVKTPVTLPKGCVNDGMTDYPGAIDCILDPAVFDCNVVSSTAPCTYESANRPNDLPVNYVAIHDIEGTAQDGLNVFQDVNSGVSIHYIVDVDGTVYELLHDKDIGYHIGNYWYNQRAIGIEHAGFDATGFQWYNAEQYMASAKLTAYLLKKYHLPLDHNHVISHGNVPAPALAFAPNHVDPGPYWLWDYYFNLIQKQGVPYGGNDRNARIIALHPRTDQRPLAGGVNETPANFNFFYLYNGPSTASGLIPHAGVNDITDETDNVEPAISYYYLAKVKDPARTGDTLYEIWYGEEDHVQDAAPSHFANGKLAWLAVPPGTTTDGGGTLVTLNLSGSTVAKVYGKPATSDNYQIGDASNNAVFVSSQTTMETGTTNLWYEINYNHRQAWVPATEVTVVHAMVA